MRAPEEIWKDLLDRISFEIEPRFESSNFWGLIVSYIFEPVRICPKRVLLTPEEHRLFQNGDYRSFTTKGWVIDVEDIQVVNFHPWATIYCHSSITLL